MFSSVSNRALLQCSFNMALACAVETACPPLNGGRTARSRHHGSHPEGNYLARQDVRDPGRSGRRRYDKCAVVH